MMISIWFVWRTKRANRMLCQGKSYRQYGGRIKKLAANLMCPDCLATVCWQEQSTLFAQEQNQIKNKCQVSTLSVMSICCLVLPLYLDRPVLNPPFFLLFIGPGGCLLGQGIKTRPSNGIGINSESQTLLSIGLLDSVQNTALHCHLTSNVVLRWPSSICHQQSA